MSDLKECFSSLSNSIGAKHSVEHFRFDLSREKYSPFWSDDVYYSYPDDNNKLSKYLYSNTAICRDTGWLWQCRPRPDKEDSQFKNQFKKLTPDGDDKYNIKKNRSKTYHSTIHNL